MGFGRASTQAAYSAPVEQPTGAKKRVGRGGFFSENPGAAPDTFLTSAPTPESSPDLLGRRNRFLGG